MNRHLLSVSLLWMNPVWTAGPFSGPEVAMDIWGRYTKGSPAIFVGFLGFQKVKSLEEKPLLGIVLFLHLYLSSGEGHRKRWCMQWCLLPAHIPCGTGTNCLHLRELWEEIRKGCVQVYSQKNGFQWVPVTTNNGGGDSYGRQADSEKNKRLISMTVIISHVKSTYHLLKYQAHYKTSQILLWR